VCEKPGRCRHAVACGFEFVAVPVEFLLQKTHLRTRC
jgi:hypothetical protein